jgi:4-aminobutyrate aminotransferase-like enzyme
MNNLQKVMSLKGDKYSPRIARFAFKNRHITHVFWLPWDCISGYDENSKGEFYFTCDQYIDDNSFTATKINAVRRGNYQGGCYVGNKQFMQAVKNRVDKTDWFIKNYIQFGNCAFGDNWNHEFVTINKNSRRCKLCQKIEYRTVENKKINQRKEIWSSL